MGLHQLEALCTLDLATGLVLIFSSFDPIPMKPQNEQKALERLLATSRGLSKKPFLYRLSFSVASI